MPAALVTSVKWMPLVCTGPGTTDGALSKAARDMVVNRLPLIVILGTRQSRLGREGLRCFVGFKPQEQLLLAIRFVDLAQPAITEHQVIVRLHVFRVDVERLVEGRDRIGVAPLKE